MTARLDNLRRLLAEKDLDALLITAPHSRRYLSGFTGSSGALLVTPDQQGVVTDFRYFEQVGSQCPGWTLIKQGTPGMAAAVGDWLKEQGAARVGFEADAMTVADYEGYQKAAPDGTEWKPHTGLVSGLRSAKESVEIEAVRRSQALADEAALQLPRLIEPGRTEKQVAWALERWMREHGADGLAFETIVASGPNGAYPHHRPTERVIQENEIVLVDFGARVNGYHSDITRTFFTGEPPAEYRERYDIVLDALHHAEAAIRPGALLRAVDSVARDHIAGHGYGEAFGHGLGHGVGLDVHEAPSLSQRAAEDGTLAVGNIVTVEPGIYLPGWGGIRIEDIALVTEGGAEIITTATKDIDAWRKGRA